jgi:hypothetical protein
MKDTNRSIFRATAVERYIQSREKVVLPHIISPRTFLCLWMLFGLLAMAGFISWLIQIPVLAAGSAVIIEQSRQDYDTRDGDLVVVSFLPPEQHSRLRVGQQMFLRFGTASERLSTSVIAVVPEIISPQAAQQRFALNPGAPLAVSQPAAVAIARLKATSSGLPASIYTGAVYPAEVKVGSRRVISLFPIISHLTGV